MQVILTILGGRVWLKTRAAPCCAILLFCVSVPGLVSAAEWAPTRPIRFILTFPPGGGTDLIGRMIAPPLGAALGQQIVADNRGGGGGIVGTDYLAHAQPDGYTFGLLSLSAHAGNATLAPKLPYDSVKDFQALTFVGRSPQTISVHPSNPAQSIADLVARAKASSRPINFATGGIGLGSHIAGELLKLQSKADMVHVPYKGGGPAMAEVMGGQVEALFVPLSTVLPVAKSGRLRVLAIASAQRSANLPGVSTMVESGFPGFIMEESWGLMMPAGTPAAAVRRLHAEAFKVLKLPEIVDRVAAQGVEIAPSTPEQLHEYLVGEIMKYRDVIQRAHIKAD
jgi:tripartite-type tricarboxylate transporter receptor subunit TctC